MALYTSGACRPHENPPDSPTLDPPTADPLAAALTTAATLDHPVRFADVVYAATGRRVLPVAPESPAGSAIVRAVSDAADSVATSMGSPGSPVHGLRRINEASRHFEDALAGALDAHPAFTCSPAKTSDGRGQRTGYPDLELLHLATGTVTYLDPKLFESGSLDSSLRTFYYQPNAGTDKVRSDAHHLVIGFGHDGNDGAWKFTSWHLVDLSGLEVELKAEFHAANRDLYGDDGHTLARSARPE